LLNVDDIVFPSSRYKAITQYFHRLSEGSEGPTFLLNHGNDRRVKIIWVNVHILNHFAFLVRRSRLNLVVVVMQSANNRFRWKEAYAES